MSEAEVLRGHALECQGQRPFWQRDWLTHGAVSRQIAVLETWLGRRLFATEGRRMVATQPLVENAVKYGVARTTRTVTIRIVATSDDQDVVLGDEDDGGDAEPEGAPPPSLGVGLSNVRDRLALRYGTGARLEVARDARGFAARISIPA